MKLKYLTLFVLSLLMHLFLLFFIDKWQRAPSEPKYEAVNLKVTAPPIAQEKVEVKTRPEKKVVRENRTSNPKEKKTAQPVFGVSKDSLKTPGTGISVPVGNTLMIEDDGKRVKDPGELRDLSRDAQLVAGTVKIKYTEDAIDAGIQGVAIADLLVNAEGMVVEVSLKRKVGYGMDESLKKAALEAKFLPRLDRNGQPQMGWTQVKFILTLE